MAEPVSRWRKPTEEDMARLDRSGPPELAAMMRAGWFVVPNEEHPEWKAAIGKMAERMLDKIDAEILAKYQAEHP